MKADEEGQIKNALQRTMYNRVHQNVKVHMFKSYGENE